MRQFQICPSCYQRNPVNAEKCGNCALPLDATSELLTDLPQPTQSDQLDQIKGSTAPPAITAETSSNSNKEEGQENSQQPEPQSAIPPTPEIKIPESLDPPKEIKDRSREDLDWLKMLDLDRDVLANQPARSIRSESLTPTDWINTLIPQSDELPKLPETGALQNPISGEDGNHSTGFESENSDGHDDDLNVLDILLNDPAEAEMENRPAADTGSQMGARVQPTITHIDPTSETEGQPFDIDELPAEDPLNSWLSDIAADFELLTDPSASPLDRLEETAAPITPTQVEETTTGVEEPKLEADLDPGDPLIREAHVAEMSPEPERYHRGFTGDLIERVEEELEAQSLNTDLEPENPGLTPAPTEQRVEDPDGHSPSDETLAAWLAELESDTATQGDSEGSVEWLDSIEAKPDSENDKLPDWLHEHGQADLSSSSTIDTLDTETFDDDALEWLIPAEELTPKVDTVDSVESTVNPNEPRLPESMESESNSAESLSHYIAEELAADVASDPALDTLLDGTAEPEVEEIEPDTPPASETATLSDIESMLDDLLDLPPSQTAEAQEMAPLSQPETGQPIIQDKSIAKVDPQTYVEAAEADPEADWLDLDWEESAAPFSDTISEPEIPTLPSEPVEPPAEIAEMFDEFLALEEEEANMQPEEGTLSDLFQESDSPIGSTASPAIENDALESLMDEPGIDAPVDSGILDPEGLFDEMSSLIKEFDTGLLGHEPPSPPNKEGDFLADSPAQLEDHLSLDQPMFQPEVPDPSIATDAFDMFEMDDEIGRNEPESDQLPLNSAAQAEKEPNLSANLEAGAEVIGQADRDASEDRSLDDILSFLNEQNEFSPLLPEDEGVDDEVTRPNPALHRFDNRADNVDALVPSAPILPPADLGEEGFDDILEGVSEMEPAAFSDPPADPVFDPFGFDAAQTAEEILSEAEIEGKAPATETPSSFSESDFTFLDEIEDAVEPETENEPAEGEALFDLFDQPGEEDPTMLDLFLDEAPDSESASAMELESISDETAVHEGGNLDIFEFNFDEEMALGSQSEDEHNDLPDFDQLAQLDQADPFMPDLSKAPADENQALELDMPEMGQDDFDWGNVEKSEPLAEPEPAFDDLFGAEFKEAQTTNGKGDMNDLAGAEESDSWLENDLFREAEPDPSLSEVQELEDFTGVFEDASISTESLPDWAKDLRPEKAAPEENRMVIDKTRSNPLSGIKNAIEIAPVIAKPIEDLTVVQKLSTMRPQAHNLKAKEIAEAVNSPFSGDPTQPVRVPAARQKYQPKFDPTQYDGMSRYKKKEGTRNFWIIFFIVCAIFILLAILFGEDAVNAIQRFIQIITG